MLSQLVPSPLVRLFAGPYVAGETLESALEVAARTFDAQGLLTTLDLLGEDVTRPEQVTSNVEIYARLIDSVAADARFENRKVRPTVSIKPSAFTIGEREDAFAAIRPLVELAKTRGVGLTIDMEDHRWTDSTLTHSVAWFEEGFDVGTVLQSRLFRTEQDIEQIPAGMRVRMVIGIYREPEEIAMTDKRQMKEALLAQSRRLLDRGAFVEFATHDEEFIVRFVESLAAEESDRAEVQMLLGVPRTGLQAKLRSGEIGPALSVRLYVPFAIGWSDATAYLRRRMDESPSMVWLVLRNLFDSQR